MIFNIIYLTIRTFAIKFYKLQNGITSIEYTILIACIATIAITLFHDGGSLAVVLERMYQNLDNNIDRLIRS
jgi:Flp/Fap pilin component.